MEKVFILALSLLLVSSMVFAETIILKSGKTVEGKIIERTDKYIKIDFYGVPLTYWLDDIDHIEGEEKLISPNIEPLSASEEKRQESEIAKEKIRDNYVNEKYGITFQCPKGWYMNVMEQKTGANELLVIFSKYPLESKASPNPNINLIVSDISTLSITDPQEYMEKSYQYLPSNIEIDMAPKTIKVNDINGAVAMCIMHSNGATQKSLQYCFIKERFAFNISMVKARTAISCSNDSGTVPMPKTGTVPLV